MASKDTKKTGFIDRFSEQNNVSNTDDSMFLNTDLIHEGISDDDLDLLLSGDIKSSSNPPKNLSPAEFSDAKLLEVNDDDDLLEFDADVNDLSMIDEVALDEELLSIDEIDTVLEEELVETTEEEPAPIEFVNDDFENAPNLTDKVPTEEIASPTSKENKEPSQALSLDSLPEENSDHFEMVISDEDEVIDLITPLAEQKAKQAQQDDIPSLNAVSSDHPSLDNSDNGSLEDVDSSESIELSLDQLASDNESSDLSVELDVEADSLDVLATATDSLTLTAVDTPIVTEQQLTSNSLDISTDDLNQNLSNDTNEVSTPVEQKSDSVELEIDDLTKEEANEISEEPELVNNTIDEVISEAELDEAIKQESINEAKEPQQAKETEEQQEDEVELVQNIVEDEDVTSSDTIIEKEALIEKEPVTEPKIEIIKTEVTEEPSTEKSSPVTPTEKISENISPAESMKAQLTSNLSGVTASLLATGVVASKVTGSDEKTSNNETKTKQGNENLEETPIEDSLKANKDSTNSELKTVLHPVPDSVKSRLRNPETLESNEQNKQAPTNDKSDEKPSIISRTIKIEAKSNQKKTLNNSQGKHTMTNDSQTALIEKIQVDIDELKRKLHSMNSDFYNAATDSATLISQVRELETKSAGDFSGTYTQSRELRRVLVEARKTFNQLASGLDMLEESMETDLFEIEKKA